MKVRVDTPGGKFWAYEHRWYHWDGHNLTTHSVRGPLFEFMGSDREARAYIEYLTLKQKKLRQFPPCNRAKVLEELKKKNYSKA